MMPFDLRLVSIRDFLRTDVDGELDFLATKDLFTEVVESCKAAGIRRLLMDFREAFASGISAADLFSLVMHGLAIGVDRSYMIAILSTPRDEVDRAELFEEYATRHGLNVAAFREIEPALAWLNGGKL